VTAEGERPQPTMSFTSSSNAVPVNAGGKKPMPPGPRSPSPTIPKSSQPSPEDQEDGDAGILYVWGSDGQHGQLGIDDEDAPSPRVVTSLKSKGIVCASCGPSHSAAVTDLGALYAWGLNEDGQLGCGDEQSRREPTVVSFPMASVVVRMVSCGYQHTAAVSLDGQVFTWGSGSMGRLGHGSDVSYSSPTVVAGMASAVFVSCGQFNTGVVSAEGVLYVTGMGDSGQLGQGDAEPRLCFTRVSQGLANEHVTQIAFGDRHALALTTSGSVFAWGDNEYGQLGLAESDNEQKLVPCRVSQGALAGVKAVQVMCGERHSSAITNQGELLTWGHWESCQLGNLVNTDQHVPVPVEALRNVRVAESCCGSANSIAISDTGQLYAWGYALDRPLPTSVEFPSGICIRTAAVGSSHFLAISKRSDEVVTWSWVVSSEEEEEGASESAGVTRPEVVGSLRGKNLIQVDARNRHFAALTSAGDVFMWGCNDDGQLGLGEGEQGQDQGEACVVECFRTMAPAVVVVKVSVGYSHTAAIDKQGRLYTWGSGMMGRLGHGNEKDRLIPTVVAGLHGVCATSVSCGQYSTAVVTDKGAVYTCGVGVADMEPHLVPKHILALPPTVMVACGDRHFAALSKGGDVLCWGDGEYGVLGIGSTTSQSLPVKVGGVLLGKTAVQIACGERHTGAVTSDGELYTWGCADTGQLGLGDLSYDQLVPRLIGGFETKVSSVSFGPVNATAVSHDGSAVFVWGYGCEGDGTVPVQVSALRDRRCKQIVCSAESILCLLPA